MASTEQLERKANRARERLAGRFQDLQYHASPRLVAKDLLGARRRARPATLPRLCRSRCEEIHSRLL